MAGTTWVGDLPIVGKYLEDLTLSWRLRRIATDLSSLKFWNEGMLSPLRRIAAGEKIKNNLAEVANKFRASEERVNKVVARLRKNRNSLIPQEFGQEFAYELDEILEYKIGHGRIREQIQALVDSGDKRRTKSEAQYIVQSIERFHMRIDAFYERLRKGRVLQNT